jgi:diacylglycerol kinase
MKYIRKRFASIRFALAGWRYTVTTQHNTWIHLTATCMVIATGWYFALTTLEWIALIICVAGVWVAELFNTALEALTDLVSPDFHPKAKIAKDVSAGAVLAASLAAVVVGVLIFGPRVVQLLE